MRHVNWDTRSRPPIWAFWLPILLLLLAAQPAVQGFTLNVVGPNNEPVPRYRWLLQEDTTKISVPGAQAVPGVNLSAGFHAAHCAVVATGNETTPPTLALDPAKAYFVTVMPTAGYTIGGVTMKGTDTVVTVVCNTLPLPTAQVTVFVFEDKYPINNEPDLPEEQGLPGFTLQLIEAGGTYGASGGRVSKDIFNNPLGTTYVPGMFNPDGSPVIDVLGSGNLVTDANGECIIQNLGQGKYSVIAVPPAGQDWHETTTIEGTNVIDAWVKPGEPPYFQEFGPPGWHVFTGFVHTFSDPTILTGGCTITGRIVNLHPSRPPDFSFHAGDPVDGAWVGLNTMTGGAASTGVFAAPCSITDPTVGTFSIPNVPAGQWSLSAWDDNLLMIFAQTAVTVTDADVQAGVKNLGDIPIFNWFHRLEAAVFNDDGGGNPANAQNGFWDVGELPIPQQALNVRFRDGSIFLTGATDLTGHFTFSETFPFFAWLVAEVDYGRYKPTGGTFIIDNGGTILPDNGWTYPSRNILVPQPQFMPDHVTPKINPNTGNNLSVTETTATTTFPFLLQGFQGFAGTTNIMEWGKIAYPPGETGGITGIVHYAITRAENDPRYANAEPWEPGIPRVQVNLYQDTNADGVIDDINGQLGVQLADADNYPLGNFPVPGEDIDRNGNGVFDYGDALQVTWTDSWDDSLPTGAQGPIFYMHGLPLDCYDGLRVYNQVRPAVFDGGYSFQGTNPVTGDPAPTLPAGTYIVEAVAPVGYLHQKEEDKNVDFGDNYIPAPQLPPPICVGDLHMVPPYLSLFPDAQVPAPFAGQMRPLPDRKQVTVTHNGNNATADFHMYTEVPIAGRFFGFVLDDLSNEFDPLSPQFGEKYSPPWLPVSIRDYTGRELYRVYTDEFGSYNGMMPTTYTINPPLPSGVLPNMLAVAVNDPGPIPDPLHPGQFITDPYFSRQYSQFTYTLQYMPGKSTFADTPVVPVAAYTGPNQYSMDCEFPAGTPLIYSVTNPAGPGGPYVSATGQTLTIVSQGDVPVPNPLYNLNDPVPAPRTILRDYGFGTVPGSVTINGVPMTNLTWTAGSISGTVAPGTTTGELRIVRGDNGMFSPFGVTVTVGNVGGRPPVVVLPGGILQDYIDAAQPNDLILVPPGNYMQLPIMWKPVRLQGWGAGSTIINAVKQPVTKLQEWRTKVQALVNSGAVDLLPGQPVGGGAGPEPGLLNTEEGPGVMVLAKNVAPAAGGFGPDPNARIDGFTITGADHGGGIFVNGYCHFLEISNNRIINNAGFYGGGIRLGHPVITMGTEVDAQNDNILIHHNHIAENGGQGNAGGGISLCSGSTGYTITDNFICGNYNVGYGGGIGHLGLSDGGLISYNTILFNQCFDQLTYPTGGGIFIGGEGAPAGGGLSLGSGSVVIVSNLIQGNNAGAGDGGGIRLEFINGQDVADNPLNPALWYEADVFNNMIVDNITGLAGGGIALQDAVKARIIHNTVANNDSTATGGLAFAPGNPNDSIPQPAGIISRANSPALAALLGADSFSDPDLVNNIIRNNRSFSFHVNTATIPNTYQLLPDVGAGQAPVYNDLAVIGPVGASLNPMNCLLTDPTGYDPSNFAGNPQFVAEYVNGGSNQILMPEVTTAITIAAAFDEGGNFIDIHPGPLAMYNPVTGLLFGDYHLTTASPAIGAGDGAIVGTSVWLGFDFDGGPRPGTAPDVGADQSTAKGDINMDGAINAIDLAILINYLNGNIVAGVAPFLAPLASADFNADGLVNAQDLLLLAAQLAG